MHCSCPKFKRVFVLVTLWYCDVSYDYFLAYHLLSVLFKFFFAHLSFYDFWYLDFLVSIIYIGRGALQASRHPGSLFLWWKFISPLLISYWYVWHIILCDILSCYLNNIFSYIFYHVISTKWCDKYMEFLYYNHNHQRCSTFLIYSWYHSDENKQNICARKKVEDGAVMDLISQCNWIHFGHCKIIIN